MRGHGAARRRAAAMVSRGADTADLIYNNQPATCHSPVLLGRDVTE